MHYLNQYVVGQENAKKVLSVAYVHLSRVLVSQSTECVQYEECSIIITACMQT